jgi:hypothetical protein
VVSFFPSGDLQYRPHGFVDLYTSVLENCTRCKTAWDLHALLFKESISFLFRQDNRVFTDLVETYRWVIGRKVVSQTSYFEEYSRRHSEGDFTTSALDDRHEMTLVLDVTDIIHELKMIRHVANKQMEILRSLITILRDPDNKAETPMYQFENHGGGNQFINLANLHHSDLNIDSENCKALAQNIKGTAKEMAIQANETLLLLITELNTMSRDAEHTHRMVCENSPSHHSAVAVR